MEVECSSPLVPPSPLLTSLASPLVDSSALPQVAPQCGVEPLVAPQVAPQCGVEPLVAPQCGEEPLVAPLAPAPAHPATGGLSATWSCLSGTHNKNKSGDIQPDQINMAVFSWYLVKRYLSSVGCYTGVHSTSHFYKLPETHGGMYNWSPFIQTI